MSRHRYHRLIRRESAGFGPWVLCGRRCRALGHGAKWGTHLIQCAVWSASQVRGGTARLTRKGRALDAEALRFALGGAP